MYLYKVSEAYVCTRTLTFSSIAVFFIRSKNLEQSKFHQLVNGQNMKKEQNITCYNIGKLHKHYL